MELGLNGQRYKLATPVRRFDAAQQPGKVSLGEHSDETNPWSSTITQDDLRDGIGVYVMDPREHITRVFWSDLQLRHKANVVLPRLPVQTEVASTSANVSGLAIFQEEVYAPHGTAVHRYDAPSDGWGASIRTLANVVTDSAVGLVGTTETLVYATGTEVDYGVSDGSGGTTWARNDEDIKFVVFHNDLLWGINNAGQLFYTDNLSTSWSSDALLRLPAGYVTGLRVARGPDREQHIYAMTRTGPWVHDDQNKRFLQTDLQMPNHPDSGSGSHVWNRGPMFISAGNSIYSFQAGSDAPVIDVMGPDRDDGLPSDRRGVISQLLSSHNELLAVLDASGGQGRSSLTVRASSGMGSSRQATFGGGLSKSSILGWDQRGWEVKWSAATAGLPITSAVVGYAHNQYRLWWAYDGYVYYMDLPLDVVNPVQLPTQKYAEEGTIEYPWFDAGVSNQEKLGLSVFVDSTNPSTAETIKIEYATDLDEDDYDELATKTASGQAEYFLPSSSDVSGKTFRYWKFKLTFERGTSALLTPVLHKIYLVYRKRVGALWGATISLDLSETYNDVSPAQQLKNLEAARYSNPLVEAVWVDDQSSGDPQNYYVDVLQLQPIERGGDASPEGAIITIVEPRQSTPR